MAATVEKPRRSAGEILKSYFPIISWLPTYQAKCFRDTIVIHAVWHNISFSKISQYRSITKLDYSTAVITLKEFLGQLLQTRLQIRFARVKNHVMEVMTSGGLEEAIPEEYFFTTVQEAVDAFLAEKEVDKRIEPASQTSSLN